MDSKYIQDHFNLQVEQVNGKLPEPRTACATQSFENGLLLHGGQSSVKGKPKLHNDFLFLDLSTCQWRKVFLLDLPKAREGHAMAKLNNDLYLYGGKGASAAMEDFWKFDFENVQWNEKKKSTDLLGVVAEKLSIKTLTPGKRHGHTMIAEASYNMLLLFGGIDQSPAQFDVFIFDIEKQIWLQSEHFGVQPAVFADP